MNHTPQHDTPICTQEAARAAGLDVAPSPSELVAMAEAIVRTWGARYAEPEDEVGSTADAGAQLARSIPLLLVELDRVRAERDELKTWHDSYVKGTKFAGREIRKRLVAAENERDEMSKRLGS